MNDNKTPTPEELDLDNLRAIKVLGKGATGTVFLVHHHHHQPFALKVVEKSSINPHATPRARHEISILRRLSDNNNNNKNPFLPHLIGSSETKDYICWATPYCSGGDLNVLRFNQNDRVFSLSVTRFYLAEIVCALEHLHGRGIVYRDLKPENILVQQSGHVTLTDFDLSRDLVPKKFCSDRDDDEDCMSVKKNNRKLLTRFLIPKRANYSRASLMKAKSARVSPVTRRIEHQNQYPDNISTNERCNSFVGTEEYVAPEIIRGEGHEFAVDWWALGVLSYEMVYGTTPFKGHNRKETFRKILLAEPNFMGRPNALTDLIRKLLQKDPTRRLGYRGGACEIKEHEFFKGLRWDLLTEVMRPPFLPSKEELTEFGGIDVREYFEKLNLPPSPLWSPSRDDNVELTELF